MRLSNSFLTKASKVYLIGEIYYNQVTQFGRVPTLVKNPPNIKMGKRNKGETIEAVSWCSNILEMKYPREEPHYTSISIIK